MGYAVIKTTSRAGDTPQKLGTFPSEESAKQMCEAAFGHMAAVNDWHPFPPDKPRGIQRQYRDGELILVVGIYPVVEQPSPRSAQPSRTGKKQAQLWIVQSGRSTVLHLMRSKNNKTPNPNSAGNVISSIVTGMSQSAKLTLCGRPASRAVGVFAPREVTCKECKRRGGFG